MAIGIKDIAVYLPSGRESNLDLASRFDVTEDFLANKIGVVHRTTRSPGQETSDMAFEALEQLLRQGKVVRDEIQVMIVVTQNPDSRLPHVSGLLHARAALPKQCATFDLSLGCSGYVYGLSVLTSFMQANGLEKGVLITCDPYSKIVDPEDKNTVLLFGDAATATLVGADPVLVPASFDFGSQGDATGSLHERDGRLHMNGRDVFNFAATVVPGSVTATLEKAGLDREDIDVYLFHQGSRYIVETLTKRLKLDSAKVRIDINDTGNTVSSSIPLLLAKELHNTIAQRILLCGFGVGLSWASCICQRTEKTHGNH
ncbi:3-oxoacyl-[acyl-carrier-protein] synthase-3 [Herbaspirillum seropedicae]|uniref:ketoacyl-ACP synthase III n=1 Tax=Herbaspirillum seropedicae TaxID=964 RepID=UPI00339459DA